MPTEQQILDEKQIAEIEALSAKVPDGPWFADADIADDVPDHRRSGLALVDTGRGGDWWIARLCEWHIANFIAASKTNVDALCQTVRVLRTDAKMKKIELLQLSGRGDLLAKEHVKFDDLDEVASVRNEFDRLRNIVIRDLQSRLSEVEKEREREREACKAANQLIIKLDSFRTHVINLCNEKAAECESLMARTEGPAFEDIHAQAGAQIAIINELREAIENLGIETTEKGPSQ